MSDARQPRIMLAMPGYGELTSGAARGFWRATRLPDEQVHYSYREGSLLAANFNACWCDALNLAHRGRPPAYFAMQHADIEPEDWWLDAMIAEMDAHGLDILGAVAPIKDSRGVTSIALARPDGDNWRPLCRLTMADVHRLPPTFTSDDVRHPLLLNTGLWACRFNLDWARKVRFTINDRIVFDRGSGRYLAQCESEDWYFSRLLHEIGLKIGCTRKIRLLHRGPHQWRSDRVWGEPHDSAYVDASPLPPSSEKTFILPDVDGWLLYEEGRELARLAAGKRVIEIGSYFGLSTVCMARTARHVTAVDWWDGRATPDQRPTFGVFAKNIQRFGLADRVFATTPDVQLDPGFDLAFIDGAHDRASVEADIAKVLPLLAKGGTIAFHDHEDAHPGVVGAVDALIGAGATLISKIGSLAVVRPPAATPQEV